MDGPSDSSNFALKEPDPDTYIQSTLNYFVPEDFFNMYNITTQNRRF